MNRFFCLIEKSFRNNLLLCAGTVVISCRNKLLIQNLILANIKLIFLLVKTILSYFFQTLLPPKITFTSSENIFFNDYFILASENSFSVSWKQYAFVRSIFLPLETMTEIRGESVLTENYFPVRGNHFLHFFPEDAVFPYSGSVFFNEFLFPAIGEGFSLQWKPSTSLEISFLPAETFTDVCENHFLKTDFIHASENSFPSQQISSSSIVSNISQGVPQPRQWKHIFQSRRKSIVFYLEPFFLLVETII